MRTFSTLACATGFKVLVQRRTFSKSDNSELSSQPLSTLGEQLSDSNY